MKKSLEIIGKISSVIVLKDQMMWVDTMYTRNRVHEIRKHVTVTD